MKLGLQKVAACFLSQASINQKNHINSCLMKHIFVRYAPVSCQPNVVFWVIWHLISLSLSLLTCSFLPESLSPSALVDRCCSSSPQLRDGDIISKTFSKRFQAALSKTPQLLQDKTLLQKGGIECNWRGKGGVESAHVCCWGGVYLNFSSTHICKYGHTDTHWNQTLINDWNALLVCQSYQMKRSALVLVLLCGFKRYFRAVNLLRHLVWLCRKLTHENNIF